METWGELMTRQEREKEALRVNRTLAWERIKNEYPDNIPPKLMEQWRAEYGDTKLAELENSQKSERQTYFGEPKQQQEVTIIPKPQTVDETQEANDLKFQKYIKEAESILEQNRQRDRDRGR
jgi:hypothetical protein